MLKRILSLIFTISLAYNMTSNHVFGYEISWSGTWNTTFKKLTIVQDGINVSGNYEHDNGRISGKVDGDVLTGTWYESGNQSGQFQFVISADGNSFTGKWGLNSGVLNSKWNGTRVTPVSTDNSSMSTQSGETGILYNSWAGTWNTTFNKLTIVQDGNNVSGNYGHDNGRISGKVDGDVLTGTWYESGNQSGQFRFVMSTDGNSFTGKWGLNSGVLNSKWNGTRVTPVSTDNSSTSTQSGETGILYNSWAGTWNTTFNKLTIVQDGNNVSGNYGHDNGRISGKVDGDDLTGTWYESGNQSGQFRFVMSADGKSFSGKWGLNSGALNSTWNGTRVK